LILTEKIIFEIYVYDLQGNQCRNFYLTQLKTLHKMT